MKLTLPVPEGPYEKALAIGERLPGTAGWMCYRKLKRRLANRSLDLFETAVRDLRPGDVAVDLGANVGEITGRLAATGATVHAFEPDPDSFAILRENMAGYPNVVLHQKAAGDRDGRTQLYRPVAYSTNERSASKANSIVRRDSRMDVAAGIDVEVVDFARFLNMLPRPARLVKVDIEGAEWAMLKAVTERALDCFEAMFVETHERFDLSILPEARRLQRFAAELERPYINLYWK